MIRVAWFLVVALLAGGQVLAADAPSLLLVKGIHGLPKKEGDAVLLAVSRGEDGSVSCVPATRPAGEVELCMPHIHPDFLAAIGYLSGIPEEAIKTVETEFDAAFAGSRVSEITARTKFRTYAVSMQVTQAGQFSARVDQFVDVMLPVSLNLYFTNIMTGEVLFSLAKTEYRNIRFTEAEYADAALVTQRVGESYRQNFNAIVKALFLEAKEKFRPLQIDAQVVRNWKGYYILDQGVDKGIAAGAELVNAAGAGVRVIYADRNYAVGVPSLGELQAGDVVSLYSTASPASIRKPRVMVLDANSPAAYPGQRVAREFTESIGDDAAFTIVSVNPSFQDVMKGIAATQGLAQAEVSQKRVLPDYFVRIWLPTAEVYDLPTNQSFAVARVSTGSAYAEMLDGSGRVVFSSAVNGEIVEEVVSGLALNVEDRLRILYGNLISDLARKFIAGVQFSRTELEIGGEQAGEITVNDPAGMLAVNQNVRAFRVDDGIVRELGVVRVPTWELQVAERRGPVAVLTAVASTAAVADAGLKLKAGDRIVLEGGRAGASRVSLELCPSAKDVGGVKFASLPMMAYFGIGQWVRAPFFAGAFPVAQDNATFASSLRRLTYAGFAKPLSTPSASAGYCVEPLLKVDELARDCSDAVRCNVTTNIVAGVQLRGGDTVAIKKAMAVKTESKGVPEAVVPRYVARKVEIQLQDLFRQLAEQSDVSALP